MISFSATVKALLEQPLIETFYLVKIGTGTWTTFHSDLTYNGTVYSASNAIVAIEPPKSTSVVDRGTFKVTLSDTSFTYGALAESGLIGLPLLVYVGFVDQTTKAPQLSVDDVLLAYDGFVDGSAYSIETAEKGTSLFTITGTSPMHDLDHVRAFYTSQDFVDKNFANLAVKDTAYNQMYDGSVQTSLRWGRV